MAVGFNISAAWAGVLVAAAVPGCSGVWYFASSQSRTETTVQMLDQRTAKMESRIDAIAERLNVRAAVPSSSIQQDKSLAVLPQERITLPNVGAKGWP